MSELHFIKNRQQYSVRSRLSVTGFDVEIVNNDGQEEHEKESGNWLVAKHGPCESSVASSRVDESAPHFNPASLHPLNP